jgi:two-component sensor histidine kinase
MAKLMDVTKKSGNKPASSDSSTATQLAALEEALYQSEARNAALLRAVPDAALVLSESGQILEISNNIAPNAELPPFAVGDSVEQWAGPEAADLCLNHIQQTLTTSELRVHKCELVVLNKRQTFEVRLTPLEAERVLALLRNVSINNYAAQQMKRITAEKQVLLREVHHRVNNNLQVINSLLYLQSRTLDSAEAKQMLLDMQQRIQALAQIHQQFTASENLAMIDMTNYVNQLTSSLSQAFNLSLMSFEITVSDIALPFDFVSRLGLLLNELLSNALKHGFPNGRSGRIQIRLNWADWQQKQLELCFSDDGVGLPDNVNPKTSESLGFILIRLLTRQLNGTITVDGQLGTTYKFLFTLEEDL